MELLEILFDFKFSKFITTKVAGVTLGIAYLAETLFALAALLGSSREGVAAFIGTFIAVIIILPMAMVGTRVWMEGMISLIKVAEESSKIRELLEKKVDSN
ncbi:DUF4282 domain-containing protein [Desulfurobacterium indicum]|uniref:DUF4282 domain-containing protein n=1 Tax=Desulfurobacterium indicum TaxID=1914305 RepID=A0A1R1ML00_9BACT|nr:DUF4282 domain-containing protein [Desulfurobacterium indicum]OMH40485.1 hypothetical protein BLW93_04945 [Desulfurobacterium indicum]